MTEKSGLFKDASEADVEQIMGLLDQQEDYFVVKARLISWDNEWRETFPMEEGDCAECESPIDTGAPAFIWGEPLGNTTTRIKASGHAVIRFFCAEEHLESYIQRWTREAGFQEFALMLYR